MLPVETPFKTYTGLDGKPLDNGYIYFGQPDQDPVAHPVTVYWDAAGTIPAAQPLRTVNGYIMRNGTPANVFYDSAYSELVRDSKARQVYYARTSDDFSIATAVATFLKNVASNAGASLMGFIQAGAGAVRMTVQDALRERTSVGQFGMVGDGTDETARFNSLCQSVPIGSSVNLLPKTYLLKNAYNERVELVGTKGTVLKAVPGATHVLSLGRLSPEWNYHRISGLTIDGNGKTTYGIDFDDDNPGAPEYGGRWTLEHVGVMNCTTGIYAKTGNIGNTYRNFFVTGCDYGMRLTTEGSVGKMHAGCAVIDVGQISGCTKAAIYINDAMDGLGQYDFNGLILQGNPGFGLFMDLHNIVPATGITFRNLWVEANATAGTVNIDGVNYTPRDIYIKDARPVVFEGTYLKDVQLVNSTVIARGCRIDDSAGNLNLDVDANSQLLVDDLYFNNGINGVPFVRSIAACFGTSPNTSYSVRGPLRSWRTNPSGGTILLKETFDGAGPWLFTGSTNVDATSVSDGVISDTCGELVIPAGATLVKQGGFFKPTAGRWVVWGIHLKLVSGQVAVSQFGYASTLGVAFQRAGEWVCSYGIQKASAGFGDVNLYFQNTSGAPATIHLADVFAVEFDSMQAAYAFCNSGAAVR